MDLSIIIPVYNTIDYLPRCVDSVIGNTGIAKEIILVDDGSTDGSGKLCDSYSDKYPYIRSIHINNSGPASAKNRGLEIATGDYVAMIDSDDEVEPLMFVRMLAEAKKNDADIVCCNYKERLPNGEDRLFDYTGKTFVLDKHSGIGSFLMKEKIYTQCWTKIYRRKLLETNRIRNVEGLKTDEDFIFNIHCFVHAAKTCVVDSPLYIYTIRETSLSKDYFNTNIDAYIDNRLLHFDIVENLIEAYAPQNREHAVFSRLYYSNELLGRIALFPDRFADKRTCGVIAYMRRHILDMLKCHSRIGLSKIGALLLFMPATWYMGYRRKKVNNK